ncbi:MAG: hypothetical protein OEL91_09240 [Burkholderiaceae bacterium]|nr:hypothetical protein [Burkholderiaceae bacterium]
MHLILVSITIAACGLAGCSSWRAYATGQAWQRNECNKLIDRQERQRCVAEVDATYEEYQRDAEEAQRSK